MSTSRLSLMLQVTVGLIAGLLLGVGISHGHARWLPALLEPIGTIFVNAIRVAVIPLVVSGLVVGTSSPGNRHRIGRLGGRAFALILALLLASALFGEALAVPIFRHQHLTPAIAVAVAPANTEGFATIVGHWFSDLVPANVFKAAADGALLPLIVVSIGFGLALSRIAEDRRAAVVRLFQGIADAALIWVGFVIRFAPFGVFALATLLATKMGAEAFRALSWYVAVYAAAGVAFTLAILYPCAVAFGRMPMGRFARAILPAQAVAFASRSSLAALPAAYECARDGLQLDVEIPEFFLPIAASIFRAGAPMAQVVGVVFLAHLYGISLSNAQLATILIASVVTSFTVPGVPGGSILVMAPVLAAANIPAAGLALLLGADTIPDMFRTTTNVTGWMSVATMLRARIAEPNRPQ